MKLHYYRDREGNFGDDLNSWIWNEVAPGIWRDADDVTVSGIGTILGPSMPPARRWVIMSSGAGYGCPRETLARTPTHVICVRGPLTAAVLGFAPETAVTDGAMLIALLPQYQPVAASERKNIVFMPHHKALKFGRWQEVCQHAGIEFLDPRDDSRSLLDKIRHARLVLANAMHAAIVADAVRVPWIPITISDQNNTFKWMDWAKSMEIEYEPSIVPRSSLLEDMQSRIIALSGLRQSFTAFETGDVIKNYEIISERLKSRRRIRFSRKSFKFAHKLISSKMIESVRDLIDRSLVRRAAAALLAASGRDPFLSEERVFAMKKNEMRNRLEILKSLPDQA
jgi:succinoglycan biosynthesis protein ExoV